MIRLLPLLLLACNQLPEAVYTPWLQDDIVIQQVMAEWEERGLDPIGEQCLAEKEWILIAWLEDREFESMCGRCAPAMCPEGRRSTLCPMGCASACYVNDRFHDYNRKVPQMVVSRDVNITDALYHELRHWLEDCTGRGISFRHEGPVWEGQWHP